MSNSSPADLAVAYRSLHRRLDEAAHEGVTPAAIAAAVEAVNAAIAAAAAVLGSGATADAVASAIQGRHPKDWTDADLTAVQDHANEAARAIRTLDNS